MKKSPRIRNFILIYSGVVVLAVLTDQLTKYFLESVLSGGKVVHIIGDWLTLYWTTNNGSAGGMLAGKSVLFFITTLIGIPVFLYMLWRSRTRNIVGRIGFALILGGTIGNAIDRAFLGDGFFNGEVRDFIRVNGFFGIFNIADSCLVVGVILAVIAILFLDYDAVFARSKKVKETLSSEQNGKINETDNEIITYTETKKTDGANKSPSTEKDVTDGKAKDVSETDERSDGNEKD